MKTDYQYIHFVKVADKPKTSVWSCRNTRCNAELGIVEWYPAWRQYCYFPGGITVYNFADLLTEELEEIKAFLKKWGEL